MKIGTRIVMIVMIAEEAEEPIVGTPTCRVARASRRQCPSVPIRVGLGVGGAGKQAKGMAHRYLLHKHTRVHIRP